MRVSGSAVADEAAAAQRPALRLGGIEEISDGRDVDGLSERVDDDRKFALVLRAEHDSPTHGVFPRITLREVCKRSTVVGGHGVPHVQQRAAWARMHVKTDRVSADQAAELDDGLEEVLLASSVLFRLENETDLRLSCPLHHDLRKR